MRIYRAGQMRLPPRLLTLRREQQGKTAIDDDDIGTLQRHREDIGLHQGIPSGHHSLLWDAFANRCRRLYRIEAVTPQIRCGW